MNASSVAGGSKSIWNAIVPQMPIFALLRNLATLERHGVLEGNRELITKKFTDKDIIQKSKILPYRFLEASKHVQSGWATDALRDAMDLSFVNIPGIDGRTAIFLDVSGSMTGEPVQRAAIFAVCLYKKTNGNARALIFNTEANDVKLSLRDSILTQAGRFYGGGGTNTSAPIRKVLNERDKFDNIILVTDEQQNTGTPFVDTLEEYKRRVNTGVKTFIVDVQPYRNALTPNTKDTYYIFGWSPSVLDYIGFCSKGFGTMVDGIKKGATGIFKEDEE
jgi:60 kDa SS-A/Ro ribonucleoprotein